VLCLLTAGMVFLTGGPYLLVGLFAILMSHEMGHYVACRLYGVDASLPYFIPFPSLVGTLGAFIRIRGPIPHRRALFDIGIAGPLAGFVVALPVLVLGILEAQWVPVPHAGEGPRYLDMGEPLLFQWVVHLIRGAEPQGMTLVIGPLGLAAWFGLLVTALNMMPVGQLDGGHVTYALWPRHAQTISRIGLGVCLLLLYFRPTWLVWTIVLWLLGRRPHPPTMLNALPPGRGRLFVGLLGFAVFAVCFTPSPFLVSWSDFFDAVLDLLPL
jgi:membrane-associated protease RseP (regulator of RpoE activity)